MTPPAPQVSVVIPTLHRPELLTQRALRSALAQTLRDIEVIVVVDGPDPATEAALRAVDDARLRVLALPRNVGPSEARNLGVDAARAPWVALLDDDDEWAPEKLERQLAAATTSACARPVVVCRYRLPHPDGERLEPPRFPQAGERLGDYLMARRRWLERDHTLMSSVLFAPRALFREVPFRTAARSHEDWDWLIRVTDLPGVQVEGLPEHLATYTFHEARPHVGSAGRWRASLAWVRGLHHGRLLSDEALVGFVVFHIAEYAARERHLSALRALSAVLWRAHARPFQWARFAATWLLPQHLRRQWRHAFDTRLGVMRSAGHRWRPA